MRGAIQSLFECTNDIFLQAHHPRILLTEALNPATLNRDSCVFQCKFIRFQTLFVKIRNRRLKFRLDRFYVISSLANRATAKKP